MNSGFIRELFLSGILTVFFLAIVGAFSGVISNRLLNNVPVVAKVNGVEVYRGTSACIDIASSGGTTKLTIKHLPLCRFPKAIYASDNVSVKGSEE